MSTQFCGTAQYVSPEVLEDRPATKECDLWALGCIVFQCLTGKMMFQGINECKYSSEESGTRMEHCSFDFYSSSLLQTSFIVFVTYFIYLKHPNKSFLTH